MESRPVFENYLLKSWKTLPGKLPMSLIKRRLKKIAVKISGPIKIKDSGFEGQAEAGCRSLSKCVIKFCAIKAGKTVLELTNKILNDLQPCYPEKIKYKCFDITLRSEGDFKVELKHNGSIIFSTESSDLNCCYKNLIIFTKENNTYVFDMDDQIKTSRLFSDSQRPHQLSEIDANPLTTGFTQTLALGGISNLGAVAGVTSQQDMLTFDLVFLLFDSLKRPVSSCLVSSSPIYAIPYRLLPLQLDNIDLLVGLSVGFSFTILAYNRRRLSLVHIDRGYDEPPCGLTQPSNREGHFYSAEYRNNTLVVYSCVKLM